MLSEYQRKLLEVMKEKPCKVEKLVCDLYNKTNYVIHHRLLKYFMKVGLKVTKIHRTISCREEAWLKPYINFNKVQRMKAKTDFEKDIWKLMNNAFFGKTVENIRKRKNIEVVSVKKRAQNLYNKPTFIRETIFSNNLTAIHHRKTSITFNKSIYIGMCVLDLSKLLMYEFYYDTINELWPNNEILNFDTDSFFLSIEADDLYEDMKKIQDRLDTSDYPKIISCVVKKIKK